MDPALRGYTAAVLDGAPESARPGIATELEEVAELVGRTTRLADVLTDVVVSPAVRRAIAAELLEGKVDPRALRVAVRALTAVRAPGAVSALHDAAAEVRHIAEFGIEELESEEPLLGHSPERARAAGYAEAVFEEIADADTLTATERELYEVARMVDASPSLRGALADPGRSIGDRRRLLGALLVGKVSAQTARLAVAALHGRVRDVVGALDWMVELAARARGWRLARVRCARDVPDAQRTALSAALRQVVGQPVELQLREDPSLLGGVVIEVGDLLIDASARHRLDQLHEQLVGAFGSERGDR